MRLTKKDRTNLQILGIIQMRLDAARTGHELHLHGREELRGRYRAQVDAWARMCSVFVEPDDVTVELPMYEPDALPHPTPAVRWWPLPDDARAHPAGVVSGQLDDVAAFVRAQWGTDEVDAYESPGEWARANAPAVVEEGPCAVRAADPDGVRAWPRSVVCPKCNARVGQRCRGVLAGGQKLYAHDERLRLAWQQRNQ